MILLPFSGDLINDKGTKRKQIRKNVEACIKAKMRAKPDAKAGEKQKEAPDKKENA